MPRCCTCRSNPYGQDGDLTMKPFPRGGAFDFGNSQIPTLPHLIPSRGGGLILIGALFIRIALSCLISCLMPMTQWTSFPQHLLLTIIITKESEEGAIGWIAAVSYSLSHHFYPDLRHLKHLTCMVCKRKVKCNPPIIIASGGLKLDDQFLLSYKVVEQI